MPFGQNDAIFGHDVGFYVFSLPMWQAVQGFVFGALIVALILTAVMHLVMGGIDFIAKPAPGAQQGPRPDARIGVDPRHPFGAARAQTQIPQIDLKLGGRAVAHLSAILAAIFVVTAVGQLFRGWKLLYSTAGAMYGAGYTDVHIRLPLMYALMAIALAIAAVLVWNVWRRRQWWPLAIGVWIVALIVLRGIVPAVYQSLIVNPNQLTKEREYIANNIAATKAAYKLNEIEQQPLSPKTPLTPAKLEANQPTLRNIRLWDPNTLVTSYRQLQELRPYYAFLDADVDRYTVNGVYRETMLSARELNIDGLPTQAQTWVNQHITYTHGFGVAMSAVNQVTNDGSPDFLVQDVPPQSVKGLEITQPRIYYGERGTGYSLVDTKDKEFDYPGPNGDVYDNYKGSGGIPISPFLNRLAFCFRFGTIKFFTTSSIQDQQQDHHPQRHPGAHHQRRAVPHPRPGPVHGHRRRPAVVGAGRLHDHRPLPVLHPAERSELPAELGEDRGRRLQRHHDVLRVRPRGPAAAHLPGGVSRRCSRPRTRCRRPCSTTCGTPRTSSTCRPRSTPRTTWTTRTCSTTRATSGRSPTTSRSRGRGAWTPTT